MPASPHRIPNAIRFAPNGSDIQHMEKRRIMRSANPLLAPEQALTLYFARAHLRAPQVEYVALERAFGRTLGAPAISDAVYPAAPRSAMDGFAVRAAETPGALRVAGEIRIGRMWPQALEPGTALRIPTGGVLPAGADCVVPIEDASLDGREVRIAEGTTAGECVNPAGSDMRPGEALLEPGRVLGGPELGVLATLGIAAVPVFRKPVAAVISSGDELVPVDGAPSPAQVRDSNRWAVSGSLEALGAAVRHMPTAPDDPARLEAILREAVATADIVVITGGSSVGEGDWTPRIVARLGEPGTIVHGLRVKPGKPTLLASIDGKPVIGLPGNPASALMILETVAAPIVSAVAGGRPRAASLRAVLAEPLSKRAGWTWYLPLRLDEAGEVPAAYPLELRSSSVSLLARAAGYAVLGESVETLEAGTQIDVMRFLRGGSL